MKSILHFLAPGEVIFAYEYLPITDKNNYNTWFEDFVKLYPFVVQQKFKKPALYCKNGWIHSKKIF
jgi:hypothetical protein